jgi:hypothetical protein
VKYVKHLLTLVLIGITLIAIGGCNTPPSITVTASGNPETREFTITEFTRIQAATAFKIQVNRSDSFKVQVTADDNLLDVLDISRSGNTLHLQTKPNTSVLNSTLSAVVTLPRLRGLDISGGARANIEEFNSNDSAAFKISGGGILNMENIKTADTTWDVSGAGSVNGEATMGDIKFIVSGAGKINLDGSGTSATIEASGVSRLDLSEFKLQSVRVILSGGSETRVDSQKITSADLSGESHLYYADSPILGKVVTSGGSTIGKQ